MTMIEQIIEAAEVSQTTFFRYFPTKEDVVLQDDYDPMIIDAYLSQPPGLAPVPAVRAAFAAFFAQLSAEQKDEQQQRIALIRTVPRLRAALIDQISQATELLAAAMAQRAGRPPGDFKARTIASAIVGGAFMAVLSALADNPDADLAALTDEALAHLESGLTL
jgi:AcrR family transcriptional regulator